MPEFEKQWKETTLSDDDLKDLEIFLCEHPEAGKLIQGTGGLSKFRWAVPGRGKSGGIRNLYVDFAYYEKIYMITCFRKNVQESLSSAQKRAIKLLIEMILNNLRKGDTQ